MIKIKATPHSNVKKNLAIVTRAVWSFFSPQESLQSSGTLIYGKQMKMTLNIRAEAIAHRLRLMKGARGINAAYPNVSAAEVVSAFVFVSKPI